MLQPVPVGFLIEDLENGDTFRALFGRLTGRCGCCGKALTDPKSKLIGIGPDCRATGDCGGQQLPARCCVTRRPDAKVTALGRAVLDGTMTKQEASAALTAQRLADPAYVDRVVNAYARRLQVQRLKKRKLALRDRIGFIEDQLTPDIIA